MSACSLREMRLPVLLLSVAALACGGGVRTSRAPLGSASSATIRAPEIFVLAFPDSVGRFGVLKRHDYDDPRLGTQVRYAGPSDLEIDTFIYPGPPADSSCPVACATAQAEGEVRGFIESFPELRRRGYVESITVRSDTVLHAAGGGWRAARHLVLDVRRDGMSQESQFRLYVFDGYEVKVRATYPRGLEAPGALDAFVTEFLDRLQSTRAEVGAPAT